VSETIDIGIDLGTTNSAIARLEGTETRIINDQRGLAFTPSAVYVNKRGTIQVGDEARKRTVSDPDNAASEFKLDMGHPGAGRHLERLGRTLTPPELSAEVLKVLRANVRSQLGQDIEAAVITVPAAFQANQTAATQEAARLAGFQHSILLMEPVAAALAYGFQEEEDNAYWLVYDFGGGTFDAAVIQHKDGLVTVVNHEGDNHLGGKLIDWDLVDRYLAPRLVELAGPKDFERKNPKWRGVFAMLKFAAEEAKIGVCRTGEPQAILIEDIEIDGKMFDLEMDLTPGDVEQVVRPYVERSINLCRKALEGARLSGADLQKVLMVGGSSQIPSIRKAVEEAIGSRLETSIDPMTVVARGAAVFAGSQLMPQMGARDLPPGTFEAELHYDPVGSEEDFDVDGRIHHPQGGELEGWTLEYVEERSKWSSGRIQLDADGTFMLTLTAEPGRRNEYAIHLCDPRGTQVPTRPARVVYIVGAVIEKVPILHTIGVWMANGRVDRFLEKGQDVGSRKTTIHRTVETIVSGDANSELRIPVVSGENARADRNNSIGSLVLPGTDIPRDLPMGSEVEITLRINESNVIIASAYIPNLDEEIEEVFTAERQLPTFAELTEQFQAEKKRLGLTREKAVETEDAQAATALGKIDGENAVQNLTTILAVAEGNPGALAEAEQKLNSLRAAIDEVEDKVQWPALVEKCREDRTWSEGIVSDYGDADDRRRIGLLETDLDEALASEDPDRVDRARDELKGHASCVLTRRPEFWVARLSWLEEQREDMRDSGEVAQLLAQGRRAIQSDDVDALKAACNQLQSLLPSDTPVPTGPGVAGSTQRVI
jgi:molecular chaperone DnaK